jgi:5-methylthioadenosine/S-adenosylhomocysteine deaminase
MRTLFCGALLLDGKTAAFGNLLVQDDRIAALCAPEDKPCADQVIDASGCLLMPALYNAHTHAAMTLMRGLGSDLPLESWLTQAIFPAEEKLTVQAVRIGTQMAMLEMLRFGTAGFADMYYHQWAACEEAIKAGMNIAPAWASDISNQAALLDRFKEHPQVRVFAGIHAEYTTQEDEILRVASFAKQHELPVHVHVSETQSETQGCLERHDATPAAYLARLGVFDRGGIAAHCVWATPQEQALLRDYGVFAVHNPISNLKLGSGVLPMAEFLDRQVPLALGTDGCASNNTLNLFEEMRFAAVLHKGIARRADLLSPKALFHMATRQGALACGFSQSGLLLPGAQADLILLDISSPHAQPMPDPYAHLAYAAQGSDVMLTMVRGQILYRDGQYLTLDAPHILRQANQWVKENLTA